MIITVSWNDFRLKYYNQNTIFIKEDDDYWYLYTLDEHFIIKCILKKQENMEERIMFRELNFVNMQNIQWVLDVSDETIQSIEKQEPVEEAVEEIEEVGGVDE